ncbi:zeta toxin family protein [Levilactobacillus parabrevis]|uniref:zeta toxin family protein n=1 Tax=Levilactobacillus parabrevis TaxID=357278 RepID=UPI0021A50068|nr:zeta toxin family protein [Levilactobacillus parabrevis]MCT4486968.1 ATPase [Levilactobacillus parabrevis]MCT4490676.1 ATPase [Levilactobacillus parabrevis]
MPEYIIIAGINGAGKSTLYDSQPLLFKNTRRINADEILRQSGGNWRKTSDNFHAMRQELKEIHRALDVRESIHVETTLSGNGRTQAELIADAKNQGFNVTLIYLALPTPDLAISRVAERVKKGGHGIPSDLIIKRYKQSLSNLPKIARLADSVSIYTNSFSLSLVFNRQGQAILFNNLSAFSWLPSTSELMGKL